MYSDVLLEFCSKHEWQLCSPENRFEMDKSKKLGAALPQGGVESFAEAEQTTDVRIFQKALGISAVADHHFEARVRF